MGGPRRHEPHNLVSDYPKQWQQQSMLFSFYLTEQGSLGSQPAIKYCVVSKYVLQILTVEILEGLDV